MKKAIFLDKDGTLIKNVPYNVNLKKITLLPYVGEGLQILSSLGYLLIIISNQSGIARGYFDEPVLQAVYKKLQELLSPNGVTLDGFYYCPHHQEGIIAQYKKECLCRKPLPGLVYKAGKEHHINLAQSFFIGDILDDCETGRRAGCQTILIDNGNETAWRFGADRMPDAIVRDFFEAATLIKNQTRQENFYSYYE